MWFIYTIEYYSAIKKNEILSFATTWMDLKSIYAKWNKADGERKILYDITYMWNLKNSSHELRYKVETDSQTYKNKLVVAKVGGGDKSRVRD